MGGPVSSERRDLLVLEPFDLRAERLEDQIDEADQTRGADVLAQVKASDVPPEVRGARVGVPDRPQVQGEERLRPASAPIEIATRWAVWSANRRTVWKWPASWLDPWPW